MDSLVDSLSPFQSLPIELLLEVFKSFDSVTLVRCSLSCQQWKIASEHDFLWRRLYQEGWKFGSIPKETNDPWRTLFRRRKEQDKNVYSLLVKATQKDERKEAVKELEDKGMEIWDELFRLLGDPSYGPSVRRLAVEHHARQILATVNRRRCSSQWERISAALSSSSSPEEVTTWEEAAILISQWEYPDLMAEDVTNTLDQLAIDVRRHLTMIEALPGNGFPTRRALEGLGHVMSHEWNFRGNASDYYNPANSFLSRVLETRLGIPISLSLVAAAVGRRVGINLRPVGFPGHFLLACDTLTGRLFVDSFNNRVMSVSESRELLGGIVPNTLSDVSSFLQPTNIPAVLSRTLANLLHCFKEKGDSLGMLGVLRQLERVRNLSPEEILMIVFISDTHKASELRRVSPHGGIPIQIIESLISQVTPHLETTLQSVKERLSGDERIHFRVGQVVRHRRYDYRGVVTGWDRKCMASEGWKLQMGIPSLTGGELQPFYHILVDHRDRPNQTTYVAQENILIPTNPQVIQHSSLGEFFLEFDSLTNSYVPNEELLHTYPQL